MASHPYQFGEAGKRNGRAKARTVSHDTYDYTSRNDPSATCVAWVDGKPCGKDTATVTLPADGHHQRPPRIEHFNCCYEHLSRGDRQRVDNQGKANPPLERGVAGRRK